MDEETIKPIESSLINENKFTPLCELHPVNACQKQGLFKKKKKKLLSQNIAALSGDVISQKGCVSAIDLLLALGWLTPAKLADWKIGKIPYLEAVLTANLAKLTKTMKEFRAWAIHSKLKPSITVYKHKSSQLRFSKSGNPTIENAYSTHYILIKANKK